MIDVVAAGPVRHPSRRPSRESRVDYRNIGQVDVKVYPVDLMQLYLTRRNLNGIAGIDLAGITPLVEKTVALGDGADYEDKSESIDLPLAKEGAYLTMIRGDNLYASGIVLVSPLEMEVLEEPGGGQGAHHRPRRSDQGIPPQGAGQGDRQRQPAVHIGGDGPAGRVHRRRSARPGHGGRPQGHAQYAFYRGTTFVGQAPQSATRSDRAAGQHAPASAEESLDANLKLQNSANSLRQNERLQQRYAQPADKSKGAAAGGFR